MISTAESTIEDGKVVSSVPVTVGIGASAGGLEALLQLFAGMPIDSSLCFVVIVHHSPDGPSLLIGILLRCATMAVEIAANDMPLQSNTVYLIPPSGGLGLSSGRFAINESAPQRRFHDPIDSLFRSLATKNGNRPIVEIGCFAFVALPSTHNAALNKQLRAIFAIVKVKGGAKHPDLPRGSRF